MIHEISGSAGDGHGGLDMGGEFLLGNEVFFQKDLARCDGWIHGSNVLIWISLRNATRTLAVKRRLVSR